MQFEVCLSALCRWLLWWSIQYIGGHSDTFVYSDVEIFKVSAGTCRARDISLNQYSWECVMNIREPQTDSRAVLLRY